MAAKTSGPESCREKWLECSCRLLLFGFKKQLQITGSLSVRPAVSAVVNFIIIYRFMFIKVSEGKKQCCCYRWRYVL